MKNKKERKPKMTIATLATTVQLLTSVIESMKKETEAMHQRAREVWDVVRGDCRDYKTKISDLERNDLMNQQQLLFERQQKSFLMGRVRALEQVAKIDPLPPEINKVYPVDLR